MTKPVLKISVVSDVVCPWCYIGKRRLEEAMSKLSERIDFEVEYFPFELNPQMPVGGVDQKQYLSEKFGGEERYELLTSQTTAVAAQEGLAFDFGAQKISPNTRNAHRLIQLAKEENKQLEMVEGFFKAYFTEGLDLSKKENLLSVAEGAGLNRTKADELLKSTDGLAEVELMQRELHKLGISGVPFYIVQNKYGISGAQPADSFIKVFEEIVASEQIAATTTGEACDVETKNC
jgi:predicted DsbA family dithiol-disulfide isomerase